VQNSKPMTNNSSRPGKREKGLKSLMPIVFVLILFIGLPLIFLQYQAQRNGLSWSEVIQRTLNKKAAPNSGQVVYNDNTSGEKTDFLIPMAVGNKYSEPPLVSQILPIDLDKDGLLDVVVCDCKNNSVSWIRQYPMGTFQETVLASDLIAPAHAEAIDFDKDGDLDLMVGVLGMLFPNNDKIGSVVILENDGKCSFKKHIVAEKIARVSDVRAGDLDNDGDMDLAVAQFGYDDGETRWIENLGNWKFQSHVLQNLSGPINVEIVDVDKDGDNDIISLVSQEWEETYCFVNDGKGHFDPKLLYGSSNQDFGSSSICMSDFDQDGDQDIIYTNGDAFDYIPPQGRPWHGVQWLENQGNIKFEYHRICNFTGAVNARPVDIDKDGDLDLFVVSAFNLWNKPESQSFIWLENTGKMEFVKHEIAKSPTHLLSLGVGDFNNDGLMDMVTGGMHTYPPYDRMSRVDVWMNNGKLGIKK
jgi:hypothetical protein